MSQRIVVLGATSKIAQEISRLAATDHKELLLVARNPDRVATVAADLQARGAAKVNYVCCDLADIKGHQPLVNGILAAMPGFDTLLLAYGTLGDQARAEESAEYALSELNTNFASAVSLLTRLSDGLAKQGRGCIAVITSVAGDRARRSNYVYGTAKGALGLFAQGLRAKLFPAGVRVLTIKLGPVDTPMTANMQGVPLLATAEAVAATIYREIESGASDVIYVPGYWRWIMMAIRCLPERIGKKLRF